MRASRWPARPNHPSALPTRTAAKTYASRGPSMSAISDLAQSFEKRSETQAGAIEQTLANAYRKHEQTLLEQLKSSEQSLRDAIQSREKSLQSLLSSTEKRTRATVLSSWKWVVLSLFLVVASSGGLLWWTGQKITSNAKLLAQQSAL